MKKVSVIINNYNTKELLKSCINNLLAQDVDLEIIVSDSGSTDGSGRMITKEFGGDRRVVLIERGNTGISHGYNLALQKATGDYYLYLGTDAFPNEEVLKGLMDYFDDQSSSLVGMGTAKLVTRDGSLDMDAHRGVLTPWTAFTHFTGLEKVFPSSKAFGGYFLTYEEMDKPHEIGSCISHFMFVQKEAQQKVGVWDEQFFVFGEDLDFCYRMRETGYKIMYLPQWEVLHYKGAGIGRKSTKDISNASTISESTKKILSTERTRAMRLYFDKHLKDKYPKIVVCLVYLGIELLEKLRCLEVRLTRI